MSSAGSERVGNSEPEDGFENITETTSINKKHLSTEEESKLTAQDSRLVPEYKAQQLETNAQRHWDLFYKRNETRFFKDRRWTTREFAELLPDSPSTDRKVMLEVGCGVGNFVFPLIEENRNDYFYYACDFSPRAVNFVRQHKLYDPNRIEAFQCDITTDTLLQHVSPNSVDIVTMVFVLSAIHPEKFSKVVRNLYEVLKPGGMVLFRDYGLYDMAQIRFKPGHKIADNFYMRQDGTRSYYFSEEQVQRLFVSDGFDTVANTYVYRRTINAKEGVDVPRIFVQSKFRKICKADVDVR